MRKSVKAYLREKKSSKCYSCIIKWEEDGISKSKEISTGIEIKGNNKRLAKIRVEELREEFEKSPEGKASRYKYSPAYYHEQHPKEPRTPEIQSAIDAHHKLLDELAKADPARADRLEEYRAS